eukprot:TRINITY_DN2102_c0_g1_i2.p1 TRINITY_DN2102_c0_g1~~TRINITY_DN2102_c0_g1_i2.p1  ORF type:complete len:237 (+),score=80.87 TRINITY_DN2102_c0_g1_i2:42-752(+)
MKRTERQCSKRKRIEDEKKKEKKEEKRRKTLSHCSIDENPGYVDEGRFYICSCGPTAEFLTHIGGEPERIVICYACSEKCHQGHKKKRLQPGMQAFCDCGAGRFKSRCSLRNVVETKMLKDTFCRVGEIPRLKKLQNRGKPSPILVVRNSDGSIHLPKASKSQEEEDESEDEEEEIKKEVKEEEEESDDEEEEEEVKEEVKEEEEDDEECQKVKKQARRLSKLMKANPKMFAHHWQ